MRKTLCGLLLAAALGFSEARAGVLRYCDPPADQSAAQQDRLLRMSAMVRDRLAALGSNVAMVARSGLNLSWWDQRYSHAGLSLRHNPSGPWFIRQLYYDCTARQPRLFDEGLAGFVSGVADPEHGYLLVLALPSSTSRGAAESEEEQGAPDVSIERMALHGPTALGLLGSQYSANAHAFSTLFQVSMPASIAAHLVARVPSIIRIEACLKDARIVLRENGPPLDDHCRAMPGDQVLAVD